MWVLAHAPCGLGHLHGLEHGEGADLRSPRVGVIVRANGFCKLSANCHDRIEGRHRLLEDHRDLPATHAPHGPFAQSR
jgi:hypothetical protein